jgi:DmsE family decaheme c-type cytochrome
VKVDASLSAPIRVSLRDRRFQENDMESSVGLRGPALLAALAVAACLSPAAAHAARTARGAALTSAAEQAQAGYAGEDVCLGCHPDHAGYGKSAHGRSWVTASPRATRGCESCHGPGRAHADSSGDKSKIATFGTGTNPRDVNDRCLACHEAGTTVQWKGSPHDARTTSCVRCHSIHAPRSPKGLLRTAGEIETCGACHRSQVQKMQRTAHMPVAQGKMACSSCHNPHGSENDSLLKAGTTVNDSCVSCHAEKRGPHLWEHAPVVEKCTTCHDAHGSTVDRMLVAKEPFLCQRCHVSVQHPATPYEGYVLANGTNSNRLYGRSCAACHQNIHGSNAPSGQAFLR